jgi:O-antigen/teichoic acid export membrane protein
MSSDLSKLNNNEFFESDSSNLGVRAARAGRWLLAVQVISKLAGLIQRVILARLIAPHDFGLMGIALLTIGGFEAISTPDLASGLIQKKGDIREYLNTYWTCQILRAVLVAGILISCAPVLAGFFGSASSVNIIRVVSLGVILRSAVNPGMVQFQKDIEFKPRFIMISSASIAGAVISIIYAVTWGNVWALVVGVIISALVTCLSSYALHPFRPKLELSIPKMIEMFKFGGWLWLAGILTFCVLQGDDLFVSRMLGITMLGYYQMAFWLANLPTTQIANVLNQISFPAYSQLQTNNMRLTEGFLKTLQGTVIIIVLYTIVIFFMAEPITVFVLGPQWEPMVPALKILCFAGLLRCISATLGPVLLAVGKPKLITIGQIIRLLILVGTLAGFTHMWGLQGTSLSVVLSLVLSSVFIGVMTMRELDVKIIPFMKKILPSCFGGVALAVTLINLQSKMIITYTPNLMISLGIGGAVYLGVILTCDLVWRCGAVEVFRYFFRTEK